MRKKTIGASAIDITATLQAHSVKWSDAVISSIVY